MKNAFISLLLLFCCFAATAQLRPDRMIIHKSSGNFMSYLPERIDSITFTKVEGRVAADVNILEVSLESLIVEINKTDACTGYKIACLTKVMVDKITDEAILSDYIDRENSMVFYDNFTRGQLSGIPLESNTNYVLLTLGMDQYGTPCSVTKAPFTTPRKPVIGNPQVAITLTDIQQRQFTAHFEPNADVKGFAVLAMEKGSLEQQFEMFGPMFGFGNIGDMVKAWGGQMTAAGDFTWKDMTPGTDYTIYAQSWDEEGTYADLNSMDMATKKLGGSGEALVSMKLGEYKLMDWYGEQLPSQFIEFIPNDQASCYRMNVVLATNYDSEKEVYQTELCQDPPMPMSNWFYFEPVTGEYQVNTSTEVVAIAAAKNADGIWGAVTEFRFTTPATVGGSAPAKQSTMKQFIPQRLPKQTQRAIGTMPLLKQNGLQLNGR